MKDLHLEFVYVLRGDHISLTCTAQAESAPRRLHLSDDQRCWLLEPEADAEGRFTCALPQAFNLLFGAVVLEAADGCHLLTPPWRFPEAYASDPRVIDSWIAARRRDQVAPPLLLHLLEGLRRMVPPSAPAAHVLARRMIELSLSGPLPGHSAQP
ncbi:hypothetical protein [Pseudooceanicola sp.]|uniref:hypothetical protein n=1 Tax=Pseudooceanicola sp. TaxID=1914328 RepID=UPI003516E328